MKITQHIPNYRLGKHEQPVTVQDDDGRLYDAVLFFDKKPTTPEIESAAVAYMSKCKAAEAEIPEVILTTTEVESVLKAKKLMEQNEKWDAWKNKTVAIKEK